MSPFVILQREKARLPHPILLYEQVLTELALATRRKGTTLLSQEEAVQVVHRSLRHFNSSCPVFEIVHDLTAANLLTGDIRRGVGFSHEMILEFYAAKGLNALILAGTEQLADIAMRVDWHEVVRMYVGLQESPANALNCLVAANVVLAVRCITAGAESSKHIEARIVQLCRLMVADKANPELASQGITALLELGTKHALRVIIHMPIERNNAFERGLWNCERPEQASLSLLRFGFTGRERLHTCLAALRGRRLSKRFIESPEFLEAQRVLIAPPVVLRYVQVVEQLEVTSALAAHVERLYASIASRLANTDLVMSCMRLATKTGLELGTLESIKRVFPADTTLSGPRAYAALRLMSGLSLSADVSAAAVEYADQCLRNGLVLLACKAAKAFNVIVLINQELILEASVSASIAGKLGRLAAVAETFTHMDITALVDDATLVAFKKRNFQLLLEHGEKLAARMIGKEQRLYECILDGSLKNTLTASFLSRLIKRYHLQHLFVDVWCFTSFQIVKRYGFVRNLVTHEVAFLHVSRFKATEDRSPQVSLIGRLVTGVVTESEVYHGKLRMQDAVFLLSNRAGPNQSDQD